jgi:hypothetical protein
MECKEANSFRLRFGYRLFEGGWRRVLVLWGCAGVLFFQAFRAP